LIASDKSISQSKLRNQLIFNGQIMGQLGAICNPAVDKEDMA